MELLPITWEKNVGIQSPFLHLLSTLSSRTRHVGSQDGLSSISSLVACLSPSVAIYLQAPNT